MTLFEVLGIIIIHYIADFIFQDEKWALGKSKNMNDLISHTLMYTLIWFLSFISFAGVNVLILGLHGDYYGYTLKILLFFPITFILHTITDYFTSRVVSKKFANKEYGSPIPNFGAFTIIGFDQVLHYVQLFTTYFLLK
jgi:hypothetical protein